MPLKYLNNVVRNILLHSFFHAKGAKTKVKRMKFQFIAF